MTVHYFRANGAWWAYTHSNGRSWYAQGATPDAARAALVERLRA